MGGELSAVGAVPSAAGVVVGREDLGSPTRAGVLEVRLEVDRLGRRHELQLRYERLGLRVLNLEPHLVRVRVRVRVAIGVGVRVGGWGWGWG